MSLRARAALAAAFAAVSSFAAAALADPPGSPAPAPSRPAKPDAAEPLPDPEIRVRVLAPSALGPWTFRIDNEGSRWLRVPADVRLLRFTVEDGDTSSRRAPRPVHCAAPAALRPDGFPDKNALLIGPGESYAETFDPRLFCFGKDAQALAGGAVVHARFGWDPPPKGARKVAPPFAVEGTTYPAEVAPQKQLVAPTIALNYYATDADEEEAAAEAAAPADDKPADDKKADDKKADDKTADDKKPADDKTAGDAKPVEEKPPVVDENAPRIEIKATPWVDAASGSRVAITITATNVGHRATLVALRSRMLSFRVNGPDGVERCAAAPPTRSIPREGFQTLKPGASVATTVLVEEACARDLFRRPGLYRVTPSLHLDESGSEIGLTAYTGTARAKEPTIVRVLTGPLPFYKSAPKTVKTEKLDEQGAE
jgi:hypothetical protein